MSTESEKALAMFRAMLNVTVARITPRAVYAAEQAADSEEPHDPAAPWPEIPPGQYQRYNRIATLLRDELLRRGPDRVNGAIP
jgi:hypothetical protein